MAGCITYCRAIIVRLCFSLHGAVMITACVMITAEHYYWGLFGSLGLLLLETLITLLVNKGHEYKWFSPCIFLYTLSVVPPVWVKELHRYFDSKTNKKEHNKSFHSSVVANYSITNPIINTQIFINATGNFTEIEHALEASELVKRILGV